MRSRKAIFSLAALWASICTPATAQEALPLVEHAGTIGALELVEVFNDICLGGFAEFSTIEAAFRQKGFDVNLDPRGSNWMVVDARRGITGRLGFHGVSEGYNYDACTVEAYVNDPDALDRKSLLSNLAEGAPLRHDPPPPSLAGRPRVIFTRCAADGSEAEISVEWPSIHQTKPSGQRTSQLERKKLSLSISRNLDYNSMDMSKGLAEAARIPC